MFYFRLFTFSCNQFKNTPFDIGLSAKPSNWAGVFIEFYAFLMHKVAAKDGKQAYRLGDTLADPIFSFPCMAELQSHIFCKRQ